MLINMRNAMMAGKRLPYDAEVEYLESTGTQWIDTGLSGRDGYDFEYRFRPLNPLPCGVGGEYEESRSCYIGLVRSNGYLAYNYYTPDAIVEVQSLTLGTDYNVKAHLYSNEQYFEVNGVRGGIDSRTGSFVSNFSLYVFAINYNNQPTSLARMRLYSLKIYSNGNPVRDFIPVRVGNVGEMYDRVSGKFAERHGDFVLGPDVVPVEYLESHGTEYIDTEIVPSATTMIDMRGVFPATAGATRFGARNGYGDRQFVLNAVSSNKLRVDMGTGVVSASQWEATGLTCSRFVANAASNTASLTTSEGDTVSHIFVSTATFGTYRIFVFAYNNVGSAVYASAMRVSSLQIYSSGAPVRSFRPVRVGSGSTWEGAMMDVLTRRIYRNAGTGAFGYGNDLKYPIPAE